MQSMNVEAIQAWLITNIAEHLGIEPQDINVWKPLTEYGLDSITGVSLAGDLEDWLTLQLSPTLLWDHPTIEELVFHLAEEVKGRSSGEAEKRHTSQVHSKGVIIGWEQAKRLLATLDELSDADVDVLLGHLVAA
jgi:acyl carrier protein